MKSLVELLVQILHDCSIRCGANPCRDILTVTRRTEYEGNSFLTITLPSFAQGLERALEEGHLSPSLFPSFRAGRKTCLPRFLGGFMERIFSPVGVLRADASPDCVFAIRQICLFAKKLNLPCTHRRERAAEAAYVYTESCLRTHVVPNNLADLFRRVSRVVWSDILGSSDNLEDLGNFTPRHGPGVTAEGIRGNGKYHFTAWPSRLDREFPLSEFGIGSISNYFDGGSFPDLSRFTQTAPRDEAPVKVCFVPKTQRAPRVIAAEPVHMQYVQQSVASWLRPRIEERGRYTSGRVNFSNQKINARLALEGSRSQEIATIDLSEASDRVSAVLVRDMLRVSPAFSRYVFACRTTRAKLPSGITIPLRKFASMGSALCFPIEAMAFFIAIVTSRLDKAGAPPTASAVKFYSSGVFVYGDDLIVPAGEAPSICQTLESFGFKVNSHKSFWNGNFRESCGMDAFNGHDVTPTYVRRPLPVDRADVHGIASAVALANQFYLAGLWRTARALRNLVESLLGPLASISQATAKDIELVLDGRPVKGRYGAGLGWVSFSNAETFDGWDINYQCLRNKRWMVTPIRKPDPLSGDPALLKCFLLIGVESIDRDHLRTSVRYGNLALKRRWALA